ncbi:MAG: hypothetical protein KY446_12685, partial [Proteobacteria bacterium]|nr:hypothetical protein [Pseudomonadota bacterium]
PTIPSGVIEAAILNYVPGYIEALTALGISLPLVVMITLQNVQGATYAVHSGYPDHPPPPITRANLECHPILVDTLGSQLDYQRALRPAIDALWNVAGYSEAQSFDASGKWKGPAR